MVDEQPRRDQSTFDGEKLTLGDETITLVMTPSYTSGTMSVIVPSRRFAISHRVPSRSG